MPPVSETVLIDFARASSDERQRVLDAVACRTSCTVEVERHDDVLRLGRVDIRRLQRAGDRVTIAALILVAVVVLIHVGRLVGGAA